MLKKIFILILALVLGGGVFYAIYALKLQSTTTTTTTTTQLSSSIVLDDEFEDWSDETHSKDAKLDYDTVFPQESVNRMDIVISEEDWATMQADMETLYGGLNTRGGGAAVDSDENPVFVEGDIYFNDTQWYNVGVRYKGNSSLKSAYQNGTGKLPFKLDFDEFEDEYPELDNQRFYGFKELSLSSGYEDSSLMHEKLATEAFDAAGVAVPETAFYELYIDYGEGSTYFGLYTVVEVVDDTVIESDFDNDDGNLYKAIGDATSFAADRVNSLEEDFDKKSNEEENDWSDIEELAEVINSDLRTSDNEAWKENLEEIFDTDAFLNYLAVNTIIQNWDTYGNMTHNYYLYNNPDTEQLTWIPWDNNESFSFGKKNSLTLTFNQISEDWPLIRYLIDDEEYRATYLSYVDEFLDEVFDTDEFRERVTFLHNLISPYVENESAPYTLLRSYDAFENSLDTLLTYIEERIDLAGAISVDSDWDYDSSASSAEMPGGARGGGQMREASADGVEDGEMRPEPPEAGMEGDEMRPEPPEEMSEGEMLDGPPIRGARPPR